MRLDVYLAKNYPETSRAVFQKLIDTQRVEVNGAKAKSARQEISESDDVRVFFPHQLTFANEIADFKKSMIFEDENVVVVNKPAGILTHAKGSLADEFTVADFVKSRIIDAKNQDLSLRAERSNLDSNLDRHANKTARDDNIEVFSKTNRPGIIHRLDRATSGVLIAAKNPDAAAFLQNQFQERKAHKTYYAIVAKAPKLTEAKIDLPIGRDPKHPSEFRVDANGKPAITSYNTLEIFPDGSALVELKPLTGRTHQLRVHLAYLNAPIVGDTIYGSGKLGDRMFLHAKELEITIPKTSDQAANQRKTFTADLPEEFQNEVEKRRNKS